MDGRSLRARSSRPAHRDSSPVSALDAAASVGKSVGLPERQRQTWPSGRQVGPQVPQLAQLMG